MERVQKELNCEPTLPADKTYFWPYFTNRKQRQKLAESQQQRSEDKEDTIVEQITYDSVVENVVIDDDNDDDDDYDDDDDILCDDMWNSHTTTVTDQYTIHDGSSCDLQITGVHYTQDTNRDIIESPQYIIQDSSSCDLQDTTELAQDTSKELSDKEVEDCIRELIQKGVSTVISHSVVIVMC